MPSLCCPHSLTPKTDTTLPLTGQRNLPEPRGGGVTLSGVGAGWVAGAGAAVLAELAVAVVSGGGGVAALAVVVGAADAALASGLVLGKGTAARLPAVAPSWVADVAAVAEPDSGATGWACGAAVAT